jgi:predicted DCC family thiol-disulfide oxidoreductase YuxK
VLDQAGLTQAQCEAAAWTLLPDGRRFQGAEAISVSLDVILGISLFGPLYRLPGLTQLEDGIYRWIAENRSRFPGSTPAVERPEGWRAE